MSARHKRLSAGIHSPSFSSRSLGSILNSSAGCFGTTAYPVRSSYMGRPITAVSVNQSLLTPVDVEIDPTIQAVRFQEKEQIKKLNNRFAHVIDKVRHLEQHNKMLETKWHLLNKGTRPTSKCEPFLNSHIMTLEAQLRQLAVDKQNLQGELKRVHEEVNERKLRYEEEIHKRTEAENEFVTLKRDVDAAYLIQSDLELKRVNLVQDMNMFKTLHEEELCELEAEIQDLSVIIEMDNSRELDMQKIMSDVKEQHEEMSLRSRKEAEVWYQAKFNKISAKADQSSEELRVSKQELSDLKRYIVRLEQDINHTKAQLASLEAQIADSNVQGEAAVLDAQTRIHNLEKALQKAKEDMAKQLRDYQYLMNIKLALDIEIATYRSLLEGEESRIGKDQIINVQTSSLPPKPRRVSAPKVLIKITEDNVSEH